MCHGTRGHKRQAEKPSRTRTWRRTMGRDSVGIADLASSSRQRSAQALGIARE
ncbi:hypothetical protein GGI42DRAFT_316940 [Trichoderma sp. SZMC 28013]